MLAIIDNLWTKTINREQAETSFKPLSLSSYEHKFVKALSALIIKLPPVSIEDVNEFELCTRFVDPFLSGLFDHYRTFLIRTYSFIYIYTQIYSFI
ncbi:hypothetical protein BCV72DRAFT_331061 [Rhizopus microsporus var. microsporus]|uniref:Uncharacterized protein n=1 Tax=Rhizopus microsporus var. microsporus TaxID=86635 RepID=A0A1X0R0H3_RHIZD|nr:hypothetical protein BCV72DRAFT_331061 [Rhizopus microsporus var. microsporus]